MEQRLNKGVAPFSAAPLIIQGAPWRIRTVDLGIRSPLLYPTELMERIRIDYTLIELIAVCFANRINGTVHAKIAFLDPHSALANTLNLIH